MLTRQKGRDIRLEEGWKEKTRIMVPVLPICPTRYLYFEMVLVSLQRDVSRPTVKMPLNVAILVEWGEIL